MPEIDGQTGITRPQRVVAPPVTEELALALLERVHREGPGAREPQRVTRPAVQLEERVAVARRAVAEVGALDESARLPGQLARRQQELVGLRAEPVERDHHPGRAVAEHVGAGEVCVPPPVVARPVEHEEGGQHRARRTPHRLVDRICRIGADHLLQPVGRRRRGREVPGDRQQARLAHGVGGHGLAEIGRGEVPLVESARVVLAPKLDRALAREVVDRPDGADRAEVERGRGLRLLGAVARMDGPQPIRVEGRLGVGGDVPDRGPHGLLRPARAGERLVLLRPVKRAQGSRSYAGSVRKSTNSSASATSSEERGRLA